VQDKNDVPYRLHGNIRSSEESILMRVFQFIW